MFHRIPHLARRIVRTLRLVVIGGALSYRALFNWTTPAMFIGTLLVGPLLQLLFFAFLGRELGVADDRFYLLGNAVARRLHGLRLRRHHGHRQRAPLRDPRSGVAEPSRTGLRSGSGALCRMY